MSQASMSGEVPELLPYYESASVFVAPLFVRGGLKFKVPQAMLCGLPVVATHVAEGISKWPQPVCCGLLLTIRMRWHPAWWRQ